LDSDTSMWEIPRDCNVDMQPGGPTCCTWHTLANATRNTLAKCRKACAYGRSQNRITAAPHGGPDCNQSPTTLDCIFSGGLERTQIYSGFLLARPKTPPTPPPCAACLVNTTPAIDPTCCCPAIGASPARNSCCFNA
jgi:hypothetical protein